MVDGDDGQREPVGAFLPLGCRAVPQAAPKVDAAYRWRIWTALHFVIGAVFSLAILAFTGTVLMSARMPGRFRGLGVAVIAGGVCATTLAAVASGYLRFVVCFGLGFEAGSGVICSASLDIASETASAGFMVAATVALFGSGGALFGAGRSVVVNAGQGP